MTTFIEKDSPSPALLIIAAISVLVLLSGLGLAYAGGVFTGKSAVIANDRRIAALNDHAEEIPPKTADSSASHATQIHPVVQDNGLKDGDKEAKDTHDRAQQGDYHQQQN